MFGEISVFRRIPDHFPQFSEGIKNLYVMTDPVPLFRAYGGEFALRIDHDDRAIGQTIAQQIDHQEAGCFPRTCRAENYDMSFVVVDQRIADLIAFRKVVASEINPL